MKKYILIIILLSSLNFLFAIRTNTFFSVDDFAVLAYFKTHSIFDTFPSFLIYGDMFGFKKVMGYIVFGLLFKTFGTNAGVFNFSLFFLQTINLILVYLISFKLSKSNPASLIVSVIFNKFYLSYYSNIHEIVLVLFSLLTIYIFLKYPKKKKYYYLTFIFSLFSKETAVFIPLILFSISFFKKLDKKEILKMLLISLFYGLYQSISFINSGSLTQNNSYSTTFNIFSIFKNFFRLIDYKLVIVLFLLPLVYKQTRYYPLLLTSLVVLLPASLLINRPENYYLYFPMALVLIYVSLFIARFNLKTVLVVGILIFIFGGREILPKIARQDFPNLQKESINKVLESGVDGNLERDAKLMIESDTSDLFIEYKNKHGNL